MDYAIIKSGNTNLLEVIKLSDWQDYEWNEFSVVNSYEDHDIKWFSYEYEAVDFILENFNKEMINPKYFTLESLNGEYYID